MTENIESLVLEHLRHIRGKIDRIADDVADLKVRMGSTESHISLLHADLVGLGNRMDRLDSRVDRIENRLDLREEV